ncbi:APC family permease, partial [Singulisphaera rosea]
EGLTPPLALLPIRGWSSLTRKALRFALRVSPEVYALHVAGDEQTMVSLEDGWEKNVREPALAAGLTPPKLIVVYSPYRRLFGPLKQVVSDLQQTHPGRVIAVIVPELVGTRWYHYVLHNRTASVIKAYLLLSGFRRIVVITVPWYLSEGVDPPLAAVGEN